MANAGIDGNSRQTLTALSSANDGTIVDLWADPTTHSLLVDASGSGLPGGNNTEIQFNDSGFFGGDTALTWNKTTNTLTVNGLTINGPVISTADSATPADISITGGSDTSGAGEGADININAGDSFGSTGGGDISMSAGTGGATGSGGNSTLRAGNGGLTSGSGGTATIAGGDAETDGDGGDVTLQGGSGNTDGNGGNVALQPGEKSGAGSNGQVFISDPSSNLAALFDTTALSNSDKTFSFPDQSGVFATVTSGTGAPGSTPAAVGQLYVDTSGLKVYASTGIASSADWKILN